MFASLINRLTTLQLGAPRKVIERKSVWLHTKVDVLADACGLSPPINLQGTRKFFTKVAKKFHLGLK